MKKYTNRLKSNNVFRAILVVQDIKDFSRYAQLSISAIYPKFHIEVFQVIKNKNTFDFCSLDHHKILNHGWVRLLVQEAELLVNVNTHVFVPEHQALTSEEKKTFLERYTVKENQVCNFFPHRKNCNVISFV